MEKEYGIEYEREVLATFDKLKTDYNKTSPVNEEPEGYVYTPAAGDAEPVDEAVSFEELTAEPSVIDAAAKEEVAATRSRKGRSKASSGDGEKGKKKKEKKEKKKKKSFWKVILYIFLVCLVIGLIAAGVIGYQVYKIIQETPEINPSNIYDLLAENSFMYDADGNLLENLYAGDALRTNVEYKDLPKNLVNAFVCIEDKTFWEHHGFNYIRIVGAVWQKVSGQRDRIGGTSTITQQLARNLYLTQTKDERSMTRKIQEAYYTIVIEKSLTKEQILEAYLNTIYLGFNSNGVQAAAEAYFSKDVKDLELMECAMLASLPQSPNAYAPIKRVATSSVQDPDSLDIVTKDDNWIIYYNNGGNTRLHLVLRFMKEQGKISEETYESLKEVTIRDYVNPGSNVTTATESSYFTDYVKKRVLSDLQTQLGYSYSEASELLYTGGLKINTTLNSSVQAILDDVYSTQSNFPDVGTLTKDKQGNILYQKTNRTDPDKILLYSMEKYFNEDGDFVLAADEFEWMPNGDLKVFGGKRLNFYQTSVGGQTEISAEFKGLYEIEEKVFYSRSGGYWNINTKYKSRDTDRNLILAADYFVDYPNAFTKNSDGTLTLSKEYFSVTSRVVQPQSSMVIMDHSNGHIVGMVGGRNITGQLLYNRATSTRQPGSSIKPLAVYSTALQKGFNQLKDTEREGDVEYTVAMPLDDAPINYNKNLWPSNWYTGYTGMTNFRHAVEQSINACAVNLYTMLDPMESIQALQNMGISSLVTSGDVNDMNASALALGGMSKGISPLEMTAAYGTFGNNGTYTEPICYTTVTNKRGDVILSKTPITHEVMDPEVAQLMTDVLRTTVTQGLATGARLKSSESAGKTGTTSEKYDIWFCGLTPKYSAAVWIGNDVNIPLKQGSSVATDVWKKVMERVMALEPEYMKFTKDEESFVTATVCKYSGKLATEACELDPRENCTITELFIKGTEPQEECDAHVTVEICNGTRYLATQECYEGEYGVSTMFGIIRPNGQSWEETLGGYVFSDGFDSSVYLKTVPDAVYDAPTLYCPIHNSDKELYPVSVFVNEDTEFDPIIIEPDPDEEPEDGELGDGMGNGDPLHPTGGEGVGSGNAPDGEGQGTSAEEEKPVYNW